MKNYIGKAKTFGKYENIAGSICLSDIPKEDIKKAKNGKSYLNFVIGNMKEPDKFGYTKTMWVDDFVPDKKDTPKEEIIPYAGETPDIDLPF